jgi:hypothetical protein
MRHETSPEPRKHERIPRGLLIVGLALAAWAVVWLFAWSVWEVLLH